MPRNFSSPIQHSTLQKHQNPSFENHNQDSAAKYKEFGIKYFIIFSTLIYSCLNQLNIEAGSGREF